MSVRCSTYKGMSSISVDPIAAIAVQCLNLVVGRAATQLTSLKAVFVYLSILSMRSLPLRASTYSQINYFPLTLYY